MPEDYKILHLFHQLHEYLELPVLKKKKKERKKVVNVTSKDLKVNQGHFFHVDTFHYFLNVLH